MEQDKSLSFSTMKKCKQLLLIALFAGFVFCNGAPKTKTFFGLFQPKELKKSFESFIKDIRAPNFFFAFKTKAVSEISVPSILIGNP